MAQQQPPLSVDEFASRIKAKYPQYADMDNFDLATRIVQKYPEYESQVDLKKNFQQPSLGGVESVGAAPSTGEINTPLGGRMMSSPDGRWAGGIGMFAQEPQQPAPVAEFVPYTQTANFNIENAIPSQNVASYESDEPFQTVISKVRNAIQSGEGQQIMGRMQQPIFEQFPAPTEEQKPQAPRITEVAPGQPYRLTEPSMGTGLMDFRDVRTQELIKENNLTQRGEQLQPFVEYATDKANQSLADQLRDLQERYSYISNQFIDLPSGGKMPPTWMPDAVGELESIAAQISFLNNVNFAKSQDENTIYYNTKNNRFEKYDTPEDFLEVVKSAADLDDVANGRFTEAELETLYKVANNWVPLTQYKQLLAGDALNLGMDINPRDLAAYEQMTGLKYNQWDIESYVNDMLRSGLSVFSESLVGGTERLAERTVGQGLRAVGVPEWIAREEGEIAGYGRALTEGVSRLFPMDPDKQDRFYNEFFTSLGSLGGFIALTALGGNVLRLGTGAAGLTGAARLSTSARVIADVKMISPAIYAAAFGEGAAQYERAYAATGDRDIAAVSWFRGLFSGSVQVIPLIGIMGKFNVATNGRFMSSMFPKMLENSVRSGGEIGLQDVAGTVLRNMSDRELYDFSRAIITEEELRGSFIAALSAMFTGFKMPSMVNADQEVMINEMYRNLRALREARGERTIEDVLTGAAEEEGMTGIRIEAPGEEGGGAVQAQTLEESARLSRIREIEAALSEDLQSLQETGESSLLPEARQELLAELERLNAQAPAVEQPAALQAPEVTPLESADPLVRYEGTPVVSFVGERVSFTDANGNLVEGDAYVDGQRVVVEDANGRIYDTFGSVEELSTQTEEQLPFNRVQPRILATEQGFTYNSDAGVMPVGTRITPQGEGLKAVKRDKNGVVKRVVVTAEDGKTYSLTGDDANALAYAMMMDQISQGNLDAKVVLNENANNAINTAITEQAQRRAQQAEATPEGQAVPATTAAAEGRDGRGTITTQTQIDETQEQPVLEGVRDGGEQAQEGQAGTELRAGEAETQITIESPTAGYSFEYASEAEIPPQLRELEPISRADVTVGGESKIRLTYSGQQLLDAGIGKLPSQAQEEVAIADVDIEQQKQKELENRVKELEEQRRALRSEDGSIPADKMSEFKRLGEEINEAKEAAKRGNSTNSMLIKRFPKGSDASVTDPEILSAKDKKEAADIIEQVIQNSKTAEEAFKKIQRLGYIFDLNVTQNLKSYLEDRFNPNAPRIGNNKDSFQAWIYGKTDAELAPLEAEATPQPTAEPPSMGAAAREGLTQPVSEVEQARAQVAEALEKAGLATPEAIAKRIRDKKISGLYSAIDFGISTTIYNKALDFMANQVERGTKLGNAIANTIRFIDEQLGKGVKWNKGMFAKAMNDQYSVTLPNGQQVEVLRDDTKETAEVINGWYQPIEQAIITNKQDKLPANKWAERLRSKEDEDAWTGVRQYLEDRGTQTVSRQELLDFIKENRVEIVEVVKGETTPVITDEGWVENEDGSLTQGIYSIVQDIDGRYDLYDTQNDDIVSTYATVEQAKEGAKSDSGVFGSAIELRYSQYQLPGDKTGYKEVLVTLSNRNMLPSGYTVKPSTDPVSGREGFRVFDKSNRPVGDTYNSEQEAINGALTVLQVDGKLPIQYKNRHFDERNILVHLRMNTRTDADGNKVLFLEEVQSDWGQEGKKKGFGSGKFVFTEENQARYSKLLAKPNLSEEEIAELKDLAKLKEAHKDNVSKTPTAPFVTETSSWVRLGIKTALKEAVKQGATKLAWTTGEQQNERYKLSNQVDNIYVQKGVEGVWEGKYYIEAASKENPNEIVLSGWYPTSELEGIVGKELTQKILNVENEQTFTGVDLEVGGTGMKGFYDSIVPSVSKAVVKELTGSEGAVSTTTINGVPQQSIEVTPQLQQAVEGGIPLFKASSEVQQAKQRLTDLWNEYQSLGFAAQNSGQNLIASAKVVAAFVNLAKAYINQGVKTAREFANKTGISIRDARLIMKAAEDDSALTLSQQDLGRISKKYFSTVDFEQSLTREEKVKQGFEEYITAKKAEAIQKVNEIRDKYKGNLADFKKYVAARNKAVVQLIQKDLRDTPMDNIRKGELKRIINNVNNAVTDAQVTRAIETAYNIFSEAGERRIYNILNKQRDRAITNIAKGKLGVVAVDSPLRAILNISPEAIPQDVINIYRSIVEELGARRAVLPLRDRQTIEEDINQVFAALQEKYDWADLLRETYEDYAAGVGTYAENIKSMLKDGVITPEQADFMRDNKALILAKEPTPVDPAEAQRLAEIKELEREEERQLYIDVLEQAQLPSKIDGVDADSNKLVTFFNNVTRKDLEALTYDQIKQLYGVYENFNSGFVPHRANSLRNVVDANRRVAAVSQVTKGYKGDILAWASKLKAYVNFTSYQFEKFRTTPKVYIDQAIGNFRNTDVFNNIFRNLGGQYSAFQSDLNTITTKVGKMYNGLSKDPRTQQEQTALISFYMIQKEFNDNPGNPEVAPTSEWLQATIKDNNSVYDTESKKVLQELFDRYATDGEFDVTKAEAAFTPAMKAAVSEMQQMNTDIIRPKAEHTASVKRGQPIRMRDSYTHIPLVQTGRDLNMENWTNGFYKPSTKAHTLTPRTGRTHATIFDPFYTFHKSAKMTLMDYYLTDEIKTVQQALGKLIKDSDGKQLDVHKDLKKIFDETLESTIAITAGTDSFADKVLNEIVKKGYQAQLAGVMRSLSEATSNYTFAAFYKGEVVLASAPVFKNNSNEVLSKVVQNVGSTESNRLYTTVGMANKNLDFSTMDIANISRVTGFDSKTASTLKNAWRRVKGTTYDKFDVLATFVLTKPDQMVARQLWFGEFRTVFRGIAGVEANFEKIAEGDAAYINKYQEAINQARDKADNTVVQAVASSNPFLGISQSQIKPSTNFAAVLAKHFNTYLTRFPRYEFHAVSRAINSLANNGVLTKQEATRLIAASFGRMSVYTLMTQHLTQVVWGAIASGLGFDVEDEEKKFDSRAIPRSVAAAVVQLAVFRNIGNVGKIPLNFIVEAANKKYGKGVTYEGDYDSYHDNIAFPLIPYDDKPITGESMTKAAIGMTGAYSPILRSLFRGSLALTRAFTSATPETREKYWNELMYRTTIEMAGSFGLIPFYKDVRGVLLKTMYNEQEKVKKSKKTSTTPRTLNL